MRTTVPTRFTVISRHGATVEKSALTVQGHGSTHSLINTPTFECGERNEDADQATWVAVKKTHKVNILVVSLRFFDDVERSSLFRAAGSREEYP